MPIPLPSTTRMSTTSTTTCTASSDENTILAAASTPSILDKSKDDAEQLQRLASRHYYSTTTALAITVGVGCVLLVLNMLIFAGIYYQRDRDKKRAAMASASNNGQESLPMSCRSAMNPQDNPTSSHEAPPCYTTLPKSPSSIQEQMMEVNRQEQVERNRTKAESLSRASSCKKEHAIPPRPPQRTSSSLSTGSSTSGSVKKRVQIQEITV
ncbi:PREDICTED: neuroligin 4-like isoform X1 [Ceratosolen solmsi marchali]|uniref:Neuroligin 4-like isoform X1 n=1 Tax=Ceratosolen solmsi marchali TaxID=326594 RepID=A0AAJ6YIK2_9HYME|nr:PREDICTED: neuroligin 4-like isoform X1 [Ceratosolen solmsi marchali]